jgi:hypothetical protein
VPDTVSRAADREAWVAVDRHHASGGGTLPKSDPAGRRSQRLGLLVLVLVLAVDVFFIALDWTLGTTTGFPEELHIHHDGGVHEWFQYAKFVVAAILMIVLARRTEPLYWVWGAIFAYLFADDAFMLHERVAAHSTRLLRLDEIGLPFEAWHVVQGLYMAAIGIGMLVALWYVARRASTSAARRFSIKAVALLILFGAFAVLGDFVGYAVFELAHLGEIVEDGGEAIAASFMLALVVAHVHRQIGSLRRGRSPS